MRLVLWLGLQPRSNFRCRHPSLRTLLRGAFRHSRELTANCGLGRKSRNFGGLTHQSVIKTTFLLYVTISGAIARE